ncbi:MAG TPA: transporter [Tepidisphaeraceae bacterium]|nr:transporter [Tepidisphaeraceae bacterium]
MYRSAIGRPLMRTVVVACVLVLITVSNLQANHGPGASGGGSSTVSGETLKPGHFEISLREDFSKFEHFSTSEAIRHAQKSGDFDALDHGFLTSLELAYGITENFQIGGGIGYFAGDDFLSADAEGGGPVETSHTNPHGFTDLSLIAKYRVLQGWTGNVALIGGVIFPTGDDDVRLENGELLSPTDQPSTGRWGFPVGIGYSRFLTPRITLDASAIYTFRLERDGIKVGDRLDTGVALAYRLTESIKTFPQYSVFLEANDVFLQKDEVDGDSEPNSGGNTLYLTPGVRVRLSPLAAITVAPSVPVWQELNGDQGKVDFKVAITMSFSF